MKWKIVAANYVSFLVLFFSPVIAVTAAKNITVLPVQQKLLAILVVKYLLHFFGYARRIGLKNIV